MCAHANGIQGGCQVTGQTRKLGSIAIYFRVIDIGLQSLPQRLRRANKARHVAGISLYGDPGRPFAVKMKSGIYWTTKDVGDAKAVEYM